MAVALLSKGEMRLLQGDGRTAPRLRLIAAVADAHETAGPLTAKQASFAVAVAAGFTLSEAYRAAYDTAGMKPATVNREASALARKPHVATRIRAEMRRISRAAQHDPAQTRSLIMRVLVDIMISSAIPTKERLRAANLLTNCGDVGFFDRR